MKYLMEYKVFERKGNYQLFHKTQSKLLEILESGYVKGGHKWDAKIRKNVFQNWEEKKYPTISCTRNLDYLSLPALELDVEKISDNYKIVPYSENPDFYLGSGMGDTKYQNKLDKLIKKDKRTNLTNLQKMIRKGPGKQLWKYKTDTGEMDHGIAEELIVTKKLDVKKYVKRIILPNYGFEKEEKKIIEEYPNIEVVRINSKNYSEVKQKLKQKKLVTV